MTALDHSESAEVGVYLVGAAGNVATAVVAGAAALRAGQTELAGLVTAAPAFAGAQLADPKRFVFAGCDREKRDPRGVWRALVDQGCVSAELAPVVEESLRQFGADLDLGFDSSSFDLDAVESNLAAFRERSGAREIVVVNVASTEPVFDAEEITTESRAVQALRSGALPASAGYALAAARSGAAHINFTPSIGCRFPAMESLSGERGVVLAGRDGKTGQTLLKAALLPLFAGRNLHVHSWFSQNILGNRDGETLQESGSLQAKQQTKSEVVANILGYQPDGQVNIDYVPALGDWKVAWDHVLFSGFLGTRMSLELSWRGSDTVLAAPLVLDLVRLVDLAARRGRSGTIPELGYFFKDPLGLAEHRLDAQYGLLLDFAGGTR